MDKYQDLISETSFQKACVGFIEQGDNILLGRRIKVSSGLGLGKWSGIGGKIGDEEDFANETVEEGMIREAKEEVGIDIHRMIYAGNIKFIFQNSHLQSLDTDIFYIEEEDWSGTPRATHVMEPQWYSKVNMPYDRMFGDNYLWVPSVLLRKKIMAVNVFEGKENVDFFLEEV